VVNLDGLEVEGCNAVEHALAAAEQDGCDVEGELLDHAGVECLPNGRGAPAVSTPFPPAASSACVKAVSKPSVTKWNAVAPASRSAHVGNG